MKAINIFSLVIAIFGVIIIISDLFFVEEFSGLGALMFGLPALVIALVVWFIGWLIDLSNKS